MSEKLANTRRDFFRKSTAMAMGLAGLNAISGSATAAPQKSLYVIAPIEGYDPHLGTLVCMMNYNRDTIVNMVKSLSKEELDHLHDEESNSIGALILHLGAVEKFYQINTFENRQDFNDVEKKLWGAAMSLGNEGRKKIRGYDASYYINAITEVRTKTLNEFKTKNDEWLMALDPEWSKEQPLNTYWKWFHVCEHESNHRGQIAWLKSRLPSQKSSKK